MRFKNLPEYIRQRCKQRDLSLTEASTRLGYSRSYLPAIAQATFGPSKDRCVEIANFFDDPPNLVLELAGFFVPNEDVQPDQEIATLASTLLPGDRRLLLELAHLLKDRSDQRRYETAKSS